MSQENVKVVRAVFAAWNEGDMDAFRELYHPDAIMRMPEGWPEPGPCFGRDAVMREFGQLREIWDADALEVISDFIDVADHVVLRFMWRGAGYGPEANMEFTGVYTVRKGRVLYVEFFWNHAEALEALGLSESAMSHENVQIARKNMEAFNRREIDAFLASLHPDVEWDDSNGFPGVQGVYRGRAGVRSWFEASWKRGKASMAKSNRPQRGAMAESSFR